MAFLMVQTRKADFVQRYSAGMFQFSVFFEQDLTRGAVYNFKIEDGIQPMIIEMDPQQRVDLRRLKVYETAIGPVGHAKAATGFIAGFTLMALDVFIKRSLKGNSYAAVELFFPEPEGIVYPEKLGYNESYQ